MNNVRRLYDSQGRPNALHDMVSQHECIFSLRDDIAVNRVLHFLANWGRPVAPDINARHLHAIDWVVTNAIERSNCHGLEDQAQ